MQYQDQHEFLFSDVLGHDFSRFDFTVVTNIGAGGGEDPERQFWDTDML